MLFNDLCKIMENIQAAKGSKVKKAIIVNFLKNSREYDPGEFGVAVQWMTGKIFCDASGKNLNFGAKQLEKAILRQRQKDVMTLTLPSISDVHRYFVALAEICGADSEDIKINHITNILDSVSELEQKYIKALILGQMPVGYGISEKNMLDCIAEANRLGKKHVAGKYAVCGDIHKVAVLAAAGRLEEISLTPFTPVKPMLAEASTVNDTLKTVKVPFLVECKYDGARCQAHKVGDTVKLYSRNLEELTAAFPEVVQGVCKAFEGHDVIVDGEIVAMQDDKPMPFQMLSKRLKRQKNIEKTMQEIPARYFVFDLLWLDGIDMTGIPHKERDERLFNLEPEYDLTIIEPVDGFYCYNADEAEKTIRESHKHFIDEGHEGVIVKDLGLPYTLNERTWIKIKAIQEKTTALDTLDCVVMSFHYGTGKYADVIGSLGLGVSWDISEEGGFAYIGDVGTGLTDEMRQMLLDALKPTIDIDIPLNDGGYRLDTYNKRMIVEVAFEEIQESQETGSGYALRFPRFIRVRDDKPMPDGVSKVERMFNAQKKVR